MKCNNRRSTGLVVLLFAVLLSAGGCASTMSTKPLPFRVQSYPLGAYVLMQIDNSGDWIYVGNTPLNIQRTVPTTFKSISIRVMKNGYYNQTNQWSAEEIQQEVQEKNMVFWNPKMVEGS